MESRFELMTRGAARLAGLILAAGLMASLTGCTFFRPAPLALPAGFAARPELAGLRSPATRQAAYKALFPELKTLWAGGTLVGRKRLRPGSEVIDFTYWSRNDADAFEHLLRMRTTRGPNITFFDLIVRGRFATVIIYPGRVVFQGSIPAEGSPLADRFGVEPWDLVPIFTIGQRVAAGDFEAKAGRRTTTLKLRGSKDDNALKRVVLDNASGLPREAEWVMGGKNYDVEYLGWDFYTDPLNEKDTRLMPSRVKVRRRGLSLDFKMREKEAYHYNQPPSEKMFTPMVPAGFEVLPLEKLKKIL